MIKMKQFRESIPEISEEIAKPTIFSSHEFKNNWYPQKFEKVDSRKIIEIIICENPSSHVGITEKPTQEVHGDLEI